MIFQCPSSNMKDEFAWSPISVVSNETFFAQLNHKKTNSPISPGKNYAKLILHECITITDHSGVVLVITSTSPLLRTLFGTLLATLATLAITLF